MCGYCVSFCVRIGHHLLNERMFGVAVPSDVLANLQTEAAIYYYSAKGSITPLSLLRHELLPVRIHGVEGEGQAPVGASENHIADHLHSTAAHFDQRLFQGISQAKDL